MKLIKNIIKTIILLPIEIIFFPFTMFLMISDYLSGFVLKPRWEYYGLGPVWREPFKEFKEVYKLSAFLWGCIIFCIILYA